MSGAGASNTASLVFTGFTPPGNTGNTEQWNGTAWTEVGDVNTARRHAGGLGTSTAALCVGGGSTAAHAQVEDWNGASWVEVGDISTARNNCSSCGTTTAGLATGGGSPGTGCEEWSGSGTLTKTIDTD